MSQWRCPKGCASIWMPDQPHCPKCSRMMEKVPQAWDKDKEYLDRYRAALGAMATALHPLVHIAGGPCKDSAPEAEQFTTVPREVTCQHCRIVCAVLATADDERTNEFQWPHPLAIIPSSQRDNPMGEKRPMNAYSRAIGKRLRQEEKLRRAQQLAGVLPPQAMATVIKDLVNDNADGDSEDDDDGDETQT